MQHQLVIGPDKVLSTPCTPCCTDDVSHIANALQQFCRSYGVKGGQYCKGLAANQLGFNRRVCVVKVAGKYVTFIDPWLSKMSGEKDSPETCFSWPGQVFNVRRAVSVTVESRGKKPMKLSGLAAVCIQHEIDHLNGVKV